VSEEQTTVVVQRYLDELGRGAGFSENALLKNENWRNREPNS